jgi:hypothetical protein
VSDTPLLEAIARAISNNRCDCGGDCWKVYHQDAKDVLDVIAARMMQDLSDWRLGRAWLTDFIRREEQHEE